MDNRFLKIVEDISAEIKRQDDKWGADRLNHPVVWNNILTEEVGEVSKAVNDSDFKEEGSPEWREELIQVAAVAMQAILYYDKINLQQW